MIDGHKHIWANGYHVLAHRFVYSMAHGILKTTDVIRHSCDNPPCIELTHLVKGTHQDNKNDSVHKMGHAHGIRHGKARLTEEQVYEIRASQLDSVYLAKKYGIAHQNIQAIKNRTHWKLLPEKSINNLILAKLEDFSE